MAGRKSLAAHYPFKALYTAGFITLVLLRLPFTLLYNVPRSLRPDRQWSYHSAVVVSLLKSWFHYVSTAEFKFATSLKPGLEGDRFITILPCSPSTYRGVLEDAVIQPARTGGTWYPRLYTKDVARGKKIILHFHGGAFVIMSSREADSGYGARSLSKHFDDALIFCPEYRLATSINGAFPAALQDAVTAYRYLLDTLHVQPSSIIVSGDSAGGNLAIGLLRYITAYKDRPEHSLPLPAAALLWSPWLDLQNKTGPDRSRNTARDIVDARLSSFAIGALVNNPSRSNLQQDPYVSPLQAPFKIDIPLWMQAGTIEVLYESIVSFAGAMQDAGSERVRFYESPNVPHDIYAGGKLLGFHQEAQDAMKEAAKFVREHEV